MYNKTKMKKIYFSNKHSMFKHYLANGSSRQSNEDYLGAIFHFTKAIEINQYSPEAYLKRGIVKAIELDQNFTEAYFNRGLLWYRVESYPDALEDFLKVVEINPNYAGVRILIGDVYWKK